MNKDFLIEWGRNVLLCLATTAAVLAVIALGWWLITILPVWLSMLGGGLIFAAAYSYPGFIEPRRSRSKVSHK